MKESKATNIDPETVLGCVLRYDSTGRVEFFERQAQIATWPAFGGPIDVCVYHGDCFDGAGAAWAVREKHQRAAWPMPVFVPGKYGTPIDADLTYGKHVLLVDFSVKLDAAIELLEGVASLTIIDHHKSAFEELYKLKHPRFALRYDNRRSGAVLAWFAYLGLTDPPPVLAYIEDRDLWTWRLEHTHEISARLSLAPPTIEEIDALALGWDRARFIREGALLETLRESIAEEIAQSATEVRMKIHDGVSISAPIAWAPRSFVSRVGNILAERHEAKLAIVISHTSVSQVTVSLRSVEGGPDVATLAVARGGGGHARAAGFQCTLGDLSLALLGAMAL